MIRKYLDDYKLRKKARLNYERSIIASTSGEYFVLGPKYYDQYPTKSFFDKCKDKEDDYTHLQFIESVILTWGLNAGYFTRNRDAQGNTYITSSLSGNSLPHKETSISQFIHLFNFGLMITESQQQDFYLAIRDSGDSHIKTQIIDLHASLIALSNTDYLHKFVNKWYKSLEMTTPVNERYKWPLVHVSIPYLWVLKLIQLVQMKYNLNTNKPK